MLLISCMSSFCILYCCCYPVSQSYLTLCDSMDCRTPGFSVLHHLSELAQTHFGDASQTSHPLWSPSHPASMFPSIRVFSSELTHNIRWPKYWSFIFSISPSNEYSGLIFFRIDWFDLAVQRTLKSFLQQHSLKTPILWHSIFFMVQLSYLYMTTEQTITLTRQTFIG